MILYATYAAKMAFVPFYNTRNETVHVLGMFCVDGHVPVFSIDDNMCNETVLLMMSIISHKGCDNNLNVQTTAPLQGATRSIVSSYPTVTHPAARHASQWVNDSSTATRCLTVSVMRAHRDKPKRTSCLGFVYCGGHGIAVNGCCSHFYGVLLGSVNSIVGGRMMGFWS